MKRCGFGAALLLVLLLGSLLVGMGMESVSRELCRELVQAKQAALAEEWSRGRACETTARDAWEKAWHPVAALTDHDLLEQMDMAFAQLALAGQLRQRHSYAALCDELCSLARQLPEEHRAPWWNIL